MRVASVFNAAYQGRPPWDIGRPQGEFVCLSQAGEIKGDVLDAGCGTGENALYLAGLGHKVWGIDIAPLAIEKAKAKAQKSGVKATFLVWDALDLQRLGRIFDTVIDCGLFHTFSDEERQEFAKSLGAVLRQGGTYYVLCFSDREPGHWGPRHITQAEIESVFNTGWRIDYIREAYFEDNLGNKGARAWLASITRL